MSESGAILLVEDDSGDAELTVTALEGQRLADRVVRVEDGEQALDYMLRTGAYEDRGGGDPAVVILDLKMPKIDGLGLLERMRGNPRLELIPVVVLTSSPEETDRLRCYELRANAYVVKPLRLRDYLESVGRAGAFWTLDNAPPPA